MPNRGRSTEYREEYAERRARHEDLAERSLMAWAADEINVRYGHCRIGMITLKDGVAGFRGVEGIYV